MIEPAESKGLRVHRSNRVEVHAALLANFLAADAPSLDPIQPITVVVGNRGTERWLGHQLARSLGICANVEFPFPGTAIARILAWALGGEKRAARWNRETVQWAVLEELTTLDPTEPIWEPLAAWLAAEPRPAEGTVDRRLLGLAQQLSSVLDRLTTFRPEWTTRWSRQIPSVLPEGVAPWLPALWCRVEKRLGPGNDADRILRAIQALRDGCPPAAPFSTLYIFGLSSLPPIWLELLGAAARHIRTDLFLLTPSNQYWSDVRRGSADLPSPLVMARDRLATQLERVLPPDHPPSADRTRPNPTLATFGRIARDFQAILERLPEGYRDAPHAEAEVFIDPVPDSAAATGPEASALAWLQSDILHMRHPADHKERLADFERRRLVPTDASIQLHSCYGLTRQLEALRDALLDLFDTWPDLQPRDVVVLCPDIQAVAPLVSAVFDSSRSPGAPPPIPARVTDRTVRELNPVAEVVLRLLAMGSSRLEAPTVLDLLSLEPVRTRFGFTPDDLPEVLELVLASGARWARDADHRAAFDQPPDPLCTWRFGLERLALGVVMADVPHTQPPLGVLPEDRAAGAPFELVGKLLDFLATLSDAVDQIATARTPDGWCTTLNGILDRLVAPTTAAGFRIRQVRQAIDGLQRLVDPTTAPLHPLKLEAPAVAAWLEGPLGADSGPLGQQTGAVTFCSLLPERGVPARVVCLLAMDDGGFPRSVRTLGFDPTTSHPRVGDRDPRDEDRYLLLEALMAARDAVLVFWTGHDVRTNETIAPAVPIGELIDVLEASFLPPRGWDSVQRYLTVHHPLQAFSTRNLVAGGLAPVPPSPKAEPHRLTSVRWTFDRRLENSARSTRGTQRPERPFWPPGHTLPTRSTDAPVDLHDLLRFWKQPVAWLVERELGLWLQDHTSHLPGREPLELDALERYQLQSDLIGAAFEDDDDSWRQVWQRRSARGQLPPGTLGRVAVEDAAAPVHVAAHLLAPFRSPTRPERIDVALPDGRSVLGSVPAVGRGTVTALLLGNPVGRRLLQTWLQVVALTAADIPTRAIVAWTGSSRKKPDITAYHPFGGDSSAARAYLSRLLQLREQGLTHPLLYGPRSSWAFMTTKLGRSGPRVCDVDSLDALSPELLQKASKEAAQHWWGTERFAGDLHHPAMERLFGRSCPILDTTGTATAEFVELAFTLWGPLLASEEQP